MSVTDSLHVGLDAWIIQDGNYADFQSGAEYRFALEFYPHALAPAPNALSPQLRQRTGGVYEGKALFCIAATLPGSSTSVFPCST